jgi:hypothetical protein
MCSVTSQGHSYARFRRALATGNPRIAEAAAREVRRLSLADALDLCLLYRAEPAKYERAAARWIARLIAERPSVRLSELELAAAAFREAPHDPRGEAVLRGLLEVGRYAA